MGTVAPPNEKQALAGELAQARALIARGQQDEALDLLEDVRGKAQARGDAEAIGEVRESARAVWLRAPRGSEVTERADRLFRAITRDDVYMTPRRRAMGRSASFWTVSLLVVGVLVVLLALASDTDAGSRWFPASFVALIVVLTIFPVVWLVGLLVLLIRKRDR